MQQDHYDYLIVGAGITAAVFAHEATHRAKAALLLTAATILQEIFILLPSTTSTSTNTELTFSIPQLSLYGIT